MSEDLSGHSLTRKGPADPKARCSGDCFMVFSEQQLELG
jgi:hypothetical protein